ncbi:limonene-1,2-epoxide hydrolase family protein [Zavarzinia sp. CC-PAN008]|uniref:limonene-1,2-epoxide hydrolase family protein n=1 Tax=Zavarzinia sp. CC-PAN008 TaxID=3243332 RepID=UPI003F7469F5
MSEPQLSADASRQLVVDFLGSWLERDVDRIMSFFADDAVYHNVPVAPIQGLDGIRGIFNGFLGAFQEINLEIVAIAASPGLVLAERIDRFLLNGKCFDLPVNGVFVLQGAKIRRFSDYFDLASFEGPSGFKL